VISYKGLAIELNRIRFTLKGLKEKGQ